MPYVIKLGIEKLIKGTKEGAQKTHTHTVFDHSHCISGTLIKVTGDNWIPRW